MIQELHVVAKVTLFFKGFSLRINSLRVGKNLRANAASQIGWTDFHGFPHNSLVSRPFSTRKVPNQSS